QFLLRQHIRPGYRVLEIGCAPGSYLACVAMRLKADVSGVDSSPIGMDLARDLFRRLRLAADLRCECLFDPSWTPGQFDFVYSAGVIEHFDDPGPVVRRHVQMLRPGGVALMTIPNYSGIYRRLQRWFDPENLVAHNLRIMSCRAMLDLAPRELCSETNAFAAGRPGPWMISFRKRFPRPIALAARAAFHALSLALPRCLPHLHSMWVLRLTRKS
ncbi:MAG: methyltransferase domain-containing protein, partial [Phycisphaerae bacterium]|nr:methyltransferase domain-containing protein [Phycisphaerae bacterium]